MQDRQLNDGVSIFDHFLRIITAKITPNPATATLNQDLSQSPHLMRRRWDVRLPGISSVHDSGYETTTGCSNKSFHTYTYIYIYTEYIFPGTVVNLHTKRKWVRASLYTQERQVLLIIIN